MELQYLVEMMETSIFNLILAVYFLKVATGSLLYSQNYNFTTFIKSLWDGEKM